MINITKSNNISLTLILNISPTNNAEYLAKEELENQGITPESPNYEQLKKIVLKKYSKNGKIIAYACVACNLTNFFTI